MLATEEPRTRSGIVKRRPGLLVMVLMALISFSSPAESVGTDGLPGGKTAAPVVTLTSTTPLVCGQDAHLNVDFHDIQDLYGYQFIIHYNPSLVAADGAFVNSWFNTADGYKPPEWDAQCAQGVCRFAASLLNPAQPVSSGGTVATVTFTPLLAGTFDVNLSDIILSDKDGFPVSVEVDEAPLTFTVCGQAAVSGQVSLQGRLTPMDEGWITLIDSSGVFPDIQEKFDESGVYSVSDIPVMPGGSTYTIRATHNMYLGSEKGLRLSPGDDLASENTRLLGGDSNNSGLNPPYTTGVNIADIACIGNWYGLGAGRCGSFSGNGTDINNDKVTNIQDLAIVAGNYMKHPFQPW